MTLCVFGLWEEQERPEGTQKEEMEGMLTRRPWR